MQITTVFAVHINEDMDAMPDLLLRRRKLDRTVFQPGNAVEPVLVTSFVGDDFP